ncbi:hypothetical protein O181_066900 [Austropuccinia psidii MF-1]|uniref:Uncharacterized protein n=1 Tax=Austropuccinia psidii MF-1 TaxID=1389203 RepID=A0A9Q3I5J6_9BASI|nr:hypothetical protein [Austropuccinia psidii MF-1]
MRNLREMLIEPPSAIKIDPIYLKKKEMVYYFIVAHLDDENYDKFFSNEDEEPYNLWNNIKENYSSSYGKNIASHFEKLFSIKFPPSSSGLSEAISSFCKALMLLRELSPIFHSIKVSSKIPTVEELFEEVKLDICRQSVTKDHTSLDLQLHSKPKKELCHKGKHNTLSNHLERECFQLFPEKREAYHQRRNEKRQKVINSSLAVCHNIRNISNKPVMDSGCSSTIAPTSNLFSNITPLRKTLLAANGSDMKVTSEGNLHLNKTTGKVLIPNSLIAPLASSVLVLLGPFLNNDATLKGFKCQGDFMI